LTLGVSAGVDLAAATILVRRVGLGQWRQWLRTREGVDGFYKRLTWRRGDFSPRYGGASVSARAGQGSERTARPRVALLGGAYGSNTWRARTSRGLGRARGSLGRRGRAWTPRTGVAWRARGAHWLAQRRGASRFQRDGFDLGHFDQVFLPKLELQCLEG
jgi:hypothetical protein